MDLSEYAIMFVLVTIMGAGIPGPGDASLIAAGALAGEGKLNIWIVLVVVGLCIRAGVAKWRATRHARTAAQNPPKVEATSE